MEGRSYLFGCICRYTYPRPGASGSHASSSSLSRCFFSMLAGLLGKVLTSEWGLLLVEGRILLRAASMCKVVVQPEATCFSSHHTERVVRYHDTRRLGCSKALQLIIVTLQNDAVLVCIFHHKVNIENRDLLWIGLVRSRSRCGVNLTLVALASKSWLRTL